jgi:hypothetical protein
MCCFFFLSCEYFVLCARSSFLYLLQESKKILFSAPLFYSFQNPIVHQVALIVDNHNKCVIANAQHPKFKSGHACSTKTKSWGNISLIGFCHNIWKDHSPMVVKMEIVSTRIDRGLNALTMDFQWIMKHNVL